MITKLLRLSLFLVLLPTVGAAEVREIGWEDLMPPADYEDPFAALTEDQLYRLGTIARTRQFVKSSNASIPDELIERAERMEQELDQEGIDVNALLALREEVIEKRIAQSQAVVPDLNGQNIRMPGYVLPLEFDGQKVTEFFLVPWVGACMHAPTPPPNQMVHVSAKNGIETEGLYEPVWVNGIMSTTGRTSAFGFYDGALDLSASYTMEALEVTPYEFE